METTTQEPTMTASQMRTRAIELEANADMLDAALLAPSMKSDSLRAEAEALRSQAWDTVVASLKAQGKLPA